MISEMNDDVKVYDTYSAKDTYNLAYKIAAEASSGDIYLMYGDLGTGKTVFAQGFAAGLGIEECVNSPTFTIMKSYYSGRLVFHHFDVYRISSPEEMYDLDYEEYLYGDGVCLIEWAELIDELLNDNVISVSIEKDMTKGCDYRKVTVKGGKRQ